MSAEKRVVLIDAFVSELIELCSSATSFFVPQFLYKIPVFNVAPSLLSYQLHPKECDNN